MTLENLIVALCVSVLAVPISAYFKEYKLTCGAIIAMFVLGVAIAYRILGGA